MFPGTAYGQRLANDVKVKPGELIVITVQAKGEVAFMWDAREFGAKHSRQDGKTLILTTGKPGAYSVNIISWDDRKVESVLVEVEGVAPKPIDPVPPDPVVPTSELGKKLQAAWAMESVEDKAKVKAYSQLYFEMSEKVKAGAYAQVEGLWRDLASLRALRMGDSESRMYLKKLGSVIGNEMNNLGMNDGAKTFDDSFRKVVSDAFRQYSAALGELR